MSLGLHDYNCRILANFVNDVEMHQQSCDCFFDVELLKIIQKHFHYGDTCIAIHDNNCYIGSIAINRVKDLIPVYSDSFHQKDSLAQYINKEVGEKRSGFRTVVKSTDIFHGSAYESSDYAAFLGVAGLRYAAILPFGDYRLCIYKADEDFANGELEVLTLIYDILFHKLETFYSMQNGKIVGYVKNELFERLDIGFMVFDENYKIAEFNQTAVGYFSKLFHKKTIINAFVDFLSLFDQRGGLKHHTLPLSGQFDEFKITVAGYSKVDSLGMIYKYYYVIMEKGTKQLSLIPGYEEDGCLACLSRRETEILEAFSRGLANNEIAASLFISTYTVRSHLRNIYKKLGVNSQRELVCLYNEYKAK